uniref:Uncharacterized protein n=1 Tax=Nelumbo nucifera TaxID=4432 RepID=A0A822Y8V4_NELNU|nr:TPA_asm: hypothetical protein HUJ06_029094 [Nelumbo nucifera]
MPKVEVQMMLLEIVVAQVKPPPEIRHRSLRLYALKLERPLELLGTKLLRPLDVLGVLILPLFASSNWRVRLDDTSRNYRLSSQASNQALFYCDRRKSISVVIYVLSRSIVIERSYKAWVIQLVYQKERVCEVNTHEDQVLKDQYSSTVHPGISSYRGWPQSVE